jgi:hypothetical protein
VLILATGLVIMGLYHFIVGRPLFMVRLGWHLLRVGPPSVDHIRQLGLTQAFVGLGIGFMQLLPLALMGAFPSGPDSTTDLVLGTMLFWGGFALVILSFAGGAAVGLRAYLSRSQSEHGK